MWIKRIAKWVGYCVLAVVGLALLALGGVYLVIGSDLGRTYEVAGEPLAFDGSAAQIAEGERISRIRGCTDGCHGRGARGNVFFEFPDGQLVAPDLGALAARYSPAELERVIRHGVKPDGTSVLRAMPSDMFASLSDADTAALIAYLKSLPSDPRELPDTSYGPLSRAMMMMFKQQFGDIMAAEVVDHDRDPPGQTPVAGAGLGEYLARTSCTECHGDDLRGQGDMPTLAIVAGYSLEDFRTLMRTGKPLGDRELNLMARIAQGRTVHFTDEEIAALHGYLQQLAGQPAG